MPSREYGRSRIEANLRPQFPQRSATQAPALVRTLSLAHATLYGLGVTIGAGIYVLVGAAAATGGMHAPLAFVFAAVLMALSAASFAELGGRFPVAAGEAAYVRAAFGSPRMALVVGALVIGIAVVSAAAISIGSAAYLSAFIALPQPVLVAGVVIAMAATAALGIKQSVTFAGAMTAIEIGGLILLIVVANFADVSLITRLPEIVPNSINPSVASGLIGTVLLAVFAFIGFESLANVAEEVIDPHRTLPRAISLTLLIATLLYVSVMWIALVAIGPTKLAHSSAPLALVFERLTGASPLVMSAVAVIATANGIIVQVIMASRVLYGLANQGDAPAIFSKVHHRTRTPVIATIAVGAIILLMALFIPLHHLAEVTARLTLLVFTIVNLALIVIKRRAVSFPTIGFVAPSWVPWAGAAACVVLLALDLWHVLIA